MSKSKAACKMIGGLVGVAAVASVFLIDWKPKEEEIPVIVRPLKTMVLGEETLVVENRYPAKVRAYQEVKMAFEVSGTIIEMLVQPPQQVEGPKYDEQGNLVQKGQLLARLDDRDYRNALDVAKAELERSRAHMQRIEIALEKKAVSQQDMTDAIAAFQVADANLKIRQKALEDTELRAPFNGRIATRFVENFENIQSKQAILSLQDISSVEIEAVLPENRVAHFRKGMTNRVTYLARFDYFKDQTFPLTFKEMTIDADPATQTYLITFGMESQTNLTILPGMTATILEQVPTELGSDDRFLLPLDVVPVDDLGNYFVWLVKDDTGTQKKVQKQKVTVDTLMDTNRIRVVQGLKRGDRIAMAGVHVLTEGQPVRLMTE